MIEIWKDIASYEGIYQVSNTGKIKVLPRRRPNYVAKEKVKKLRLDSLGQYLIVDLIKDKSKVTRLVHRLVATAFVQNPNGYRIVNHINGDKTDNNSVNLEWCTRSYNALHSYHVLGRTPPSLGKFGKSNHKSIPVVQIDKRSNLIIGSYENAMEVGRQKGYDPSTIHKCCKGQLKSYKGSYWKYAKANHKILITK